ncbi:MAG: hypothetical protein ACJ8J0_05850 [Longimicrobiaceae bacterium]
MRYGSGRTMAVALALAATLAPAGGAAGQSGTRMHSEFVDGRHRVSVTATGEVRFTDDDRAVAYVEPGARLVIEEEMPGQPDRRVEYRGVGGGVQRRFFRDGREVQPGGEDEAWIRRALLQPIRESGINAAERTARIYRRGGVDAVLDEIRQIGSDGGKSRYYAALLRLPLRAGETARVLRDAGSRIGSDGDKQRTLAVLLERRSITSEEMEAMLEAAARIGSDGDKARLLIAAAARAPLTDADVRDAFFRTAAGIGSDGDKSRVLIQAAARDPFGDAAARAAFFRTAAGIGSDGDKSRVLISVLARGDVRRETVVDAVRTARDIGSDGDKSRVLMAVPAQFLRDRAVRGAYEEAMQGIGSDGDRSRVALYLVRSRS